MVSPTSSLPPTSTSLRLAALAGGASPSGSKSWFEALADAWGEALDNQANKLTKLSSEVGGGGAKSDDPSKLTMLTAESMRMQFMANSSSTSLNAAGNALETSARKQ
jgi:hypothetical protein